MGVAVHLLGQRRVEHDGGPAPAVRGHKVWGLLAYLLLSGVPPARTQLAGLLFPDADDPARALRWNLAQLRRLVGPEAAVAGDPVALVLPPGSLVDVHVLAGGSPAEALHLPGAGHDLLEGLAFARSPGFELWLTTERRRLAGVTAGVLHEAALTRLAGGEAAEAADLAARLVALDPFDENAHVLLVRCLRAAGDARAAERQVAACTDLFLHELGVRPTPALRAAAMVSPSGEPRTMGRAAILAQLEAGEAAISAGAVDVGLGSLRSASVGARAADEDDLLVRALVALGSALVHAARGSDEDGAAALHEAASHAERLGDRRSAAVAHRELGYVDFLRGRYGRAQARLRTAAEAADGRDAELAWVETVTGAVHTDLADYRAAADSLARGVDRAAAADDRRGAAYGSAFLGRLHLLRGDLDEARRCLQDALAAARAETWTTFVPWPEALLADVDLRSGRLGEAEHGWEHALALGEQLGDPCWESISTRGLGLVAAARGRTEDALALLGDAPRLCRRLPDSYLWIEAYAVDALCGLAVEHARDSAAAWIDLLERIAGRSGMRELLVRAALHRDRLGQPGAVAAAAALARSIDNPALHEALAGVSV